MRCGSPLWTRLVWVCAVLLLGPGANGDPSHAHATLAVSAPHLFYTCPVGSTARLLCTQSGAALHPEDMLKHLWIFTPHSDQICKDRVGPRKINLHSHGNRSLPPGVTYGTSEHSFWVTLQNVSYSDQGRYCCMALDLKNKHILQRPHSHVILQVTPRRNGSQECTVWDPTPPGGSVPVALAISACILALLSLPLILVLVYKQRQNAHTHRRAQELVRMDSEAHGHDNPVFLGGSPQNKIRTVSQIMTRQTSESSRHLLSDPGTPLSPPAHGDVFFPIEDTIPESPDFL
ncbi:V-type immunoglobulin domain-containing suppressor of T-cell activation isoform X2 [Sphaeramia orbicularis]|uniref:V-type immunoglobulin domain-containing suppressor of T-cell activation isoform X2 n=1 Tax=Sphaeramia orbicularis TaxID=375764 RepID=UPI00117C732E|nr:V-type immunoglobulin domain-containing suppressor of T-cell activation isoform X2 [Sphaeramia orbicularis]